MAFAGAFWGISNTRLMHANRWHWGTWKLNYWGKTQIGAACPQKWTDVSFRKLRTADGCIYSGHKAGGD
ncbi:MAG: hypothetical protein QME62_09370 [Armatimonadota bacterium]|nr:hypothetical protein [Armatimonadota bacterium]